MKYRPCIILLSACLITNFLTLPTAEAFYFGMKVGGYFPQSNEVLMKDADTGLGVEVAGGHFFGKHIALELGVGTYQTKVPVFTSFGSQIDTTMDVMPITLSLKAGPRLGDFFPYIIAGGGVYFAEIQTPFDSEKDNNFGSIFGIGASYKGFGVEARYFAANVNLLKSDVKIDGFLLTLNYSIGNLGN